MEINLKGLVASKYGSAAKFAKEIGWSETKTRDIVSKRRVPTAKDMEKMAVALNLNTAETFCSIFFPNVCYNVDE